MSVALSLAAKPEYTIEEAVELAVETAVQKFGLQRFAEAFTYVSELAEESMPLAA